MKYFTDISLGILAESSEADSIKSQNIFRRFKQKKEGKETGNLADTLMEELQCKTVFTEIDILEGVLSTL